MDASDDRAPKVQFSGVDVVRTLAVAAVVFSHISYYLVDSLHISWWANNAIDYVFVDQMGLNLHLSIVGVSMFMMLTGLLSTRSAIKESRQEFIFRRAQRLIPAFWFMIAVSVVLVKTGVTGLFSGTHLDNTDAVLSFFLGGFFLEPEVLVLQVTWTLAVQVAFYALCLATRSVLRTRPILVPIAGGAVCAAVLLASQYLPSPFDIPMVAKMAVIMPVLFFGQIAYLGYAKLASGRMVVVAVIVQMEVVYFGIRMHAPLGADRNMWTLICVCGLSLLLARYNGPGARSRVVHWCATRSYAIYLIHTLTLYPVFSQIAPYLGVNGGISMFLLFTGLISEALYRWIEAPAARWIGAKLQRQVNSRVAL